MTNTDTLQIKSSKLLRAEWLTALVSEISDGKLSTGEWLHLLERIRVEGPKLARPDFADWHKRFLWINRQIERKNDLRWIVEQVLLDMFWANDHSR
ncbi:MAG: hypothetical protein WC054_00485 [Candidatus Nanopelagicales bacterium]